MFRKRGWMLVCAALCALGGGAARAAVLVKTRPLGSALADVGRRVIRSQTEWKRLVDIYAWPGGPAPAYPRVDWAREMVVAVSMGTRPTAGYEIKISSVRQDAQGILVTLRERRPGIDELVAQVETYPSDAVAIPRTESPVRFQLPGGSVVHEKRAGASSGGSLSALDQERLSRITITLRERGGFANLNRETTVAMHARQNNTARNALGRGRVRRAYEVTPQQMRELERVIRASRFVQLRPTYAPARSFPDQMARTLQVEMDGRTTVVTVLDGAQNPPQGFEAVWAAVRKAIAGKTAR